MGIIFIALLLIPLTGPVYSAPAVREDCCLTGGDDPPAAQRQVILLVLDRLSYPLMRSKAGAVLNSMLSAGTVGLMNIRAGGSNTESGYLSIGAGARAVAGAEGGQAYQWEENVEGIPAAQRYRRNTGRFPAGQVCHLQINTLLGKNDRLSYPVRVGELGQQLADKGLAVAVFGNADQVSPNRSAVLIAMDRQGEVPLGQVDPGILKIDPLFPFGYRADVERLSQRVAESLSAVSLVVIEFGDFARLDQYWGQLSPTRQEALLEQTMGELDRLLGYLQPPAGAERVLALVTPTLPANLPGGGEGLAPCLFLTGSPLPGLLKSTNTRRPGLITNGDLTPVIVSYLSGEIADITGGTLVERHPHPDPLGFLDQFYNRSNLIYRQRPFLLKGYVLLLIGWLFLSLGSVLLKVPAAAKLNHGFKFIMLVPLAILLLSWWPGFPALSVYNSALLLAGFTGLLLALFALFELKGGQYFWAALGLITASALILDTANGSILQQSSLLGYDPIAGARYYGLGNEYMGVLIGSTLLGSITMVGGGPMEKLLVPALGEKGKRPAALGVFIIYLLIIYLFASPNYGANLGGTLAAGVAFGAAWMGLGLYRAGKTERIGTLGSFLLIALLFLWILNGPEQACMPSHVGQLGKVVAGEGGAALWETAGRKVAMNWRLIRYSIWSRVLVALLGVMIVLCFYPVGALKSLYRKEPALLQVSAAGGIGALAALIANDSGVVAAALMLLYTVPPLWISVVDETVAKTIRI